MTSQRQMTAGDTLFIKRGRQVTRRHQVVPPKLFHMMVKVFHESKGGSCLVSLMVSLLPTFSGGGVHVACPDTG